MDNSHNSVVKICSCPVERSTTYQQHFLQHEIIKTPVISKGLKNCDIDLISGHIANNLRFNIQPIKSKTWPKLLTHAENYDEFLKRLECYNKGVFNLYFKCSPIDKIIIESFLKNLNKTVYQQSFSPEIFTPRTEKRRFERLKAHRVNMKYEQTTYRTYYNRIEEMKRFKDILQCTKFRENNDNLKNDLKKILYCGRTAYNDEMSMLGKVYAKPTLPGPIDRYTLRKI